MTIHDNEREPIDPGSPEDACPQCGERACDEPVWLDDQCVECQCDKTVYRPGGARNARDDSTS